MNFNTLLFGNGLGRALDHNYFPLDAGISSIWNDTTDSLLTAINKASIIRCLPPQSGAGQAMPRSESELATLHRVVTACQLIREVENNNPVWLTRHGRDFPQVINHFIGRVAHYFHQCPTQSDDYTRFIESLVTFIKTYYVHIATLNYDNLLYQPLVEADVLSGYSGHLLDGFTGMTFDDTNMDRRRRELGWYLHLHGSPLFYDHNSRVKKLRQNQLDASFDPDDVYHRHIVLSHTKTKPEIISGSSLLSSYWDFFGNALDESDQLIVFGYGGGDTHVNKRVSDWVISSKKRKKEIRVIVVERKNTASTFSDRKAYWKQRFDSKGLLTDGEMKLKRLDNILLFDWDSAVA